MSVNGPVNRLNIILGLKKSENKLSSKLEGYSVLSKNSHNQYFGANVKNVDLNHTYLLCNLKSG